MIEIKTAEALYYDSVKHCNNRMIVCNRVNCKFCDVKWVKVDDIRKELVSSKSRLHILKELK